MVFAREAVAIYDGLMDAASSSACDAFDRHVVASILAVAASEAGGDDAVLCERLGLEGDALVELGRIVFPSAGAVFARVARAAYLTVNEEEHALRDILLLYSADSSILRGALAAMIARRCKAPHHLWQDLGLRNRGELSRLMDRHFTALARRNSSDMKWKKFLYRLVCRAEGFSLCVAPVCSDCDDFTNCFGAEDGESMLARARNGKQVPQDA